MTKNSRYSVFCSQRVYTVEIMQLISVKKWWFIVVNEDNVQCLRVIW